MATTWWAWDLSGHHICSSRPLHALQSRDDSPPPLGHISVLYRPATRNTHYALRRLATSFSVKCKQRSQTSSNLVLSQMTVRHKPTNQQTNKQANRKSIDALVWGSLRLAPIINVVCMQKRGESTPYPPLWETLSIEVNPLLTNDAPMRHDLVNSP